MVDDATQHLNIGRLLLNAFRWMDAGFETLMDARGWACPKSNSLVFPHLLDGGIRPAEIARRAGVSRQAVHEVLTDLQAMGLVELQPDPADRRAKLVVLTSRGLEFDDAIGDVTTELERELAGRIGARRLAALREALEADWGPPLRDGADGRAASSSTGTHRESARRAR